MMKKYIITFSFLLTIGFHSFGQSTDQLVSKCVMNAGTNTRYLKDFRIELGKGVAQSELRYKANISLWKNNKYRFTMCNTGNSKGQLILSLKDDANKIIFSSYNQKTGTIAPFVDFICSKSGIYQLNYDFTNSQKGSGVGVVSMVK